MRYCSCSSSSSSLSLYKLASSCTSNCDSNSSVAPQGARNRRSRKSKNCNRKQKPVCHSKYCLSKMTRPTHRHRSGTRDPLDETGTRTSTESTYNTSTRCSCDSFRILIFHIQRQTRDLLTKKARAFISPCSDHHIKINLPTTVHVGIVPSIGTSPLVV